MISNSPLEAMTINFTSGTSRVNNLLFDSPSMSLQLRLSVGLLINMAFLQQVEVQLIDVSSFGTP